MMAVLIQRPICIDTFPIYFRNYGFLASLCNPAVPRKGDVEDTVCTLDQHRKYKYVFLKINVMNPQHHFSLHQKSRVVWMMQRAFKLLNKNDSESEFEQTVHTTRSSFSPCFAYITSINFLQRESVKETKTNLDKSCLVF